MTGPRIGSETDYGCETYGRLRRVLLHRPAGLGRITRENCRRWLFDDVPDIPRFQDEHDRYREVLAACGVEVVELADCLDDGHERLEALPNLTYLHDVAAVSSRGALLSAMASDARRGEEAVVREALGRLGIPILCDFDGPDDAFEGCLLLSPETLLVAHTERHSAETIWSFIPRALEHFGEVIYAAVPKARRFMHPDTVYNRLDDDLALAYPPAFERTLVCTREGVRPVDFLEHMRAKGVRIVPVSDDEQAALACSFVPIEPRVMVHYDRSLSAATQRRLGRLGVELILFHPEALLAGGGSLRCLTLRLHREPTA